MIVLTQLVLSVVALGTPFPGMNTVAIADPDDVGGSFYSTTALGRTSSFLPVAGVVDEAGLESSGQTEIGPAVRPSGGIVSEMSIFAFERHRSPDRRRLPRMSWQTAWFAREPAAQVQLQRLGNPILAKEEQRHDSYVLSSRRHGRILGTGIVTPMFPSIRLACFRKGA